MAKQRIFQPIDVVLNEGFERLQNLIWDAKDFHAARGDQWRVRMRLIKLGFTAMDLAARCEKPRNLSDDRERAISNLRDKYSRETDLD